VPPGPDYRRAESANRVAAVRTALIKPSLPATGKTHPIRSFTIGKQLEA